MQPTDSGGPSPLLEAHPGAPLDLSGRRPVPPTSARSEGSNTAPRSPRSPELGGRIEEGIRRDDVAAKESASVGNRDENNETKSPQRGMQVAPVQPFYIPAKVPEEAQLSTTPVSGSDSMSVDASTDSSPMDLDLETNTGVWISAHPATRECRTNLATPTTASPPSHSGGLTIDTSVASSAASMISSSAASVQSAASSDIYGWEEELERQMTMEGRHDLERELQGVSLSGGGTMEPGVQSGVHDYQQYKPGDGKKKSLLSRVLNLSRRRGSERPDVARSTMSDPPSTEECPTTSA